ncbi:hypothetical protein H4R19_002733 [Coemansia spiralis]|nr:hypothetical protein H4R19_002733 [Coemansia spiralis]
MSGFSVAGGSNSQAQQRQRCAICGTKRMSHRSDGRLMCKRGHEQAGFIEEEAEGIMEGSTRRRTKSQRRETKSEQRRKQRVYGSNARFLVIQGMQYILKLQATMLVENEGAPAVLVEAVRKLWLLYVSELEVVKAYAVDGDSATAEPTASASATQPASQSDDYSADRSLDFLLAKIDDDIARDNMELLEFEQQQEQQEYEELEPDSTPIEIDGAATDHSQAAKRAARSDRALLAHIEAFPRMEFLPAILFLACVWLRLPVSCADLYYLMADERIPYVSAHRYVPVEIGTRLGDNAISIFAVPHPPGAVRLQALASVLETVYRKNHALEFPAPDIPLVLLALIRRLDLSITVYPMVMDVLELTGRNTGVAGRQRPQAQLNAMAAIIVCLKLHYGLDEIERVSRPGSTAPELDLPPLRSFLAKWRRDWALGLSVGVAPFLTAYGENWEQAFSAHFRRTEARPHAGHMPVLKAAFRALGPKYRQIVDALAADQELGAEAAQRLLPPEYARGSVSHRPLSGREERVHAERAWRARDGTAELAAQIDPLHMCALFSLLSGDETSRPPCASLATPFDNHPEIQLQRGEQYFMFVTRQRATGGPGYMLPVLGLVLARCATVLGCTQDALIRRLATIEAALAKAMDIQT